MFLEAKNGVFLTLSHQLELETKLPKGLLSKCGELNFADETVGSSHSSISPDDSFLAVSVNESEKGLSLCVTLIALSSSSS